MTGRDTGLDACRASAARWRQEAKHLRALAGGAHLTPEQGATLLREAEAADRQAAWWIAGDGGLGCWRSPPSWPPHTS